MESEKEPGIRDLGWAESGGGAPVRRRSEEITGAIGGEGDL